MSYYPSHTQDAKHSAAMLEMHTTLDKISPFQGVSSSSYQHKSKSSKHNSDAASVFSTSSFSSTRALLKDKFFSSSSNRDGGSSK